MNRDSGADQPTQRTVAELLAEYGNSGGQKGGGNNNRRRRRRAEDPSETAPQAIIERVLSDSGQMRAIQPDAEPPQHRSHRVSGRRPATPPPEAQPPAAQPPVAQPPTGPPSAAPLPAAQQPPATPVAPEPEQSAPEVPEADASANQAGGASYWAQRFASAGGKKPAPAEGDAEATIQQPALRADAPPVPPTASKKPRPPEGVTEQLPRVAAPAVRPRPDVEGTEVMAVPPVPVAKSKPEPVEEEPKHEDEDPYDFDSFEEPEAQYADEDDYDPELPAGMDADDYRDEEEDAEPPSPAKEWGTLVLQGVAGLVAGGAVWFGFRWLWGFHAMAALGAALLFTGLLVLIAWKFLRNNDLQTILLAVLVGLFCTVSPAALLLISH
ncbi:hypothetical protein [Saccharopolyspora sp. NPDC002376]